MDWLLNNWEMVLGSALAAASIVTRVTPTPRDDALLAAALNILGRLSLLKGAKRMFGPQAWWELAKMLIKTLLVTGLVYQTVSALIPMIGGLVPLATGSQPGSSNRSRTRSRTPCSICHIIRRRQFLVKRSW